MSENVGQKIDIDGTLIYYEKVGNGGQNVLFLPGVLGSIDIDFCDQMKGFDKSKFTMIGWDPPGYGKSRPNKRVFIDWYQKDADLVLKLMKMIGIEYFSIVAFSDGARTAMLFTAQNPEMVEKLVLCGGSCFQTPAQVKTLMLHRNISAWGVDKAKKYKEIYGDDLQEMWENWTDALIKTRNMIKKKVLDKIQCPTFIIHGGRDVMAPYETHVSHLKYNIQNSRTHVFPKASHTCHQEYPNQFNHLVQEFLLKKF